MEHYNALTLAYEGYLKNDLSKIRELGKQGIDFNNQILDFDLGHAMELNNSLSDDDKKKTNSLENMLNTATFIAELFLKVKDYRINIIGACFLTDKQILDIERSNIENLTIDNMTLNDKEIIRRYKKLTIEPSNDPDEHVVKVRHM